MRRTTCGAVTRTSVGAARLSTAVPERVERLHLECDDVSSFEHLEAWRPRDRRRRSRSELGARRSGRRRGGRARRSRGRREGRAPRQGWSRGRRRGRRVRSEFEFDSDGQKFGSGAGEGGVTATAVFERGTGRLEGFQVLERGEAGDEVKHFGRRLLVPISSHSRRQRGRVRVRSLFDETAGRTKSTVPLPALRRPKSHRQSRGGASTLTV